MEKKDRGKKSRSLQRNHLIKKRKLLKKKNVKKKRKKKKKRIKIKIGVEVQVPLHPFSPRFQPSHQAQPILYALSAGRCCVLPSKVMEHLLKVC